MKAKTSELQGRALNWAVAHCEGLSPFSSKAGTYFQLPNYLSDWSQSGPIIERENLEIKSGNPIYFPKGNEKGEYFEPLWLSGKQCGSTPILAALRCYIAIKLGDEVEIPDELA